MSSTEERLTELLCDLSLVDLAPAEEAELNALLLETGPRGEWERECLERAAVAIAVAGTAPAQEAMPEGLLARVEERALQTIGTVGAPAAPPRALVAPVAPVVPITRGARRVSTVVAWMAAAACFALAVGSWLFRPHEVVVTKEVFVPASAASTPTPPPQAPTPTPEVERERLLAEKGTEHTEWSATKDRLAGGAAGDVVWNQAEQRGFMRFRGLAKNDPSVAQYQLWIFDKTRDARYPVDGGVFDIGDGTGDVIVPTHARIPVGEPVLFAVTVEKPGGVVVSKREHIVLTAKTRA
jgi:hypothetical protein